MGLLDYVGLGFNINFVGSNSGKWEFICWLVFLVFSEVFISRIVFLCWLSIFGLFRGIGEGFSRKFLVFW